MPDLDFLSQLNGAFLALGLISDRDATGEIGFVCPRCPVALDVSPPAVLCCSCGFEATGEPWEIAKAASEAKPKEAEPTSYSLAGRRFDASKPPPEEPVIFAINGVEICHPGNITTLEAQQKGGKSAFVAAAIASTFARRKDADCLGWQSDNKAGRAVLHFDTEQSLGDHYRLMMRSLAMAETEQPPFLESYCITGFTCAQMREAISERVEYAKQHFGGVHSMFLDGVADPVKDVNDAEESFEFVGWLHSIAIAGGFPIISVLHLNPGDSGKSRGHLGSHLNRKSEHVLRLTKSGDISTVVSQWSRRAAIGEDKQPNFRWCDERKRHVTTTEVAPPPKKNGRPSIFRSSLILKTMGARSMTTSEIMGEMVKLKWSKGTFKKLWGGLIENGEVVKSIASPDEYQVKSEQKLR